MAAPSNQPGKLAIRPYGEGDRDPVVALWKSCGLTTHWNAPDQDIALFRTTASAEIFLGERGEHLAAALAVGHDGHRGCHHVTPSKTQVSFRTASVPLLPPKYRTSFVWAR